MLSVAIADTDLDICRQALFTQDGNENCVFLVGGFSRLDNHASVLIRDVVTVPPGAYRERTPIHLDVAPAFINTVIDRAIARGLAIVTVHSHPGSHAAKYSLSDDYGESRLTGVFLDLIPGAPHGSLLLTPDAMGGRRWTGQTFEPFNEIRVSGGALRRITLSKEDAIPPHEPAGPLYDRQILAFGRESQAALVNMRAAIVGVGGTGSSVAEQLARLGVQNLWLVDPDRFEASNLSRTYGTGRKDLQKPDLKVALIARALRRINPAVKVTTVADSIVKQQVLMGLRKCDVVFGCTDNDWSRATLNRFAYQYLVPLIDMGTRIVVESNRIRGVAGRVSLASAGLPCLRCSNHLSSERIRVESMPTAERARLAQERYIQGVNEAEPSVISLNTTVAGLAVTKFLDLIAPFSERNVRVSDQIYDASEGVVFRSRAEANPQCNICSLTGLKGLGDLQVVSAYE